MLFNNLTVAFRILLRQKTFSAITIFGLTIGLTVSLLIGLYIQNELSYDRFHEKANRIYRLTATLHLPSGPSHRAVTSPPMALILHNDFPEIEKTVKIANSSRPLSYRDKTLYDIKLLTADSAFFDVFTFPFVKGDQATALDAPNAVVLTESAARKFFGPEEPLGKVMVMSDTISLLVTGIMRDIPANAHFHFDCIYSRATMTRQFGEPSDAWFQNGFYTYVLLPPSASTKDLEEKFPAMLDRHMGADRKNSMWYELQLQPLTGIHLTSSLQSEIEPTSSMLYIYTFGSIAIFILLIACINFMNLSTAKATGRANEVGVRKVAGAAQGQLMRQFLSESCLLAFIASLFAVVLAEVMLPAFNSLVERSLSIAFSNTRLFVGFAGVTLLVGLLAGVYPAFFLSRFGPAEVFKGKPIAARRGTLLRQVLVVFQFSNSIILIAGTVLVNRQMDFLRNQDLGFDQEQLVVLPVHGTETSGRFEAIRQKFLQDPHVINISVSSNPLGHAMSRIATLPEGAKEDEIYSVNTLAADQHFLDTHQIQLVAGRNFLDEHPSDIKEAFLINQSAARLFGWGDGAVGKKLDWGLGKEGSVVGVVNDFHYLSLHKKVEPLIIHMLPQWYSTLTIRIKTGKQSHYKQSLASLEQDWKTLGMKGPFEYFFLDDDFNKQYQSEQRLGSFFQYFSALAIVIACLGLLGLATYTTGQRTKEIGIRKVLGASVSGLVGLLSGEFLKLVIIANILAWPLAWYGMDQWLSNFAYRTEIGVSIFIFSGVLALLIALLTVGLESFKAAITNPVRSLRSE